MIPHYAYNRNHCPINQIIKTLTVTTTPEPNLKPNYNHKSSPLHLKTQSPEQLSGDLAEKMRQIVLTKYMIVVLSPNPLFFLFSSLTICQYQERSYTILSKRVGAIGQNSSATENNPTIRKKSRAKISERPVFYYDIKPTLEFCFCTKLELTKEVSLSTKKFSFIKRDL